MIKHEAEINNGMRDGHRELTTVFQPGMSASSAGRPTSAAMHRACSIACFRYAPNSVYHSAESRSGRGSCAWRFRGFQTLQRRLGSSGVCGHRWRRPPAAGPLAVRLGAQGASASLLSSREPPA